MFQGCLFSKVRHNFHKQWKRLALKNLNKVLFLIFWFLRASSYKNEIHFIKANLELMKLLLFEKRLEAYSAHCQTSTMKLFENWSGYWMQLGNILLLTKHTWNIWDNICRWYDHHYIRNGVGCFFWENSYSYSNLKMIEIILIIKQMLYF